MYDKNCNNICYQRVKSKNKKLNIYAHKSGKSKNLYYCYKIFECSNDPKKI